MTDNDKNMLEYARRIFKKSNYSSSFYDNKQYEIKYTAHNPMKSEKDLTDVQDSAENNEELGACGGHSVALEKTTSNYELDTCYDEWHHTTLSSQQSLYHHSSYS